MKEPLRNTGKLITKVKKYKNHVNIYFGDEKLEVSNDVFTSFYLYKGKEVSDHEYRELTSRIDNEKLLAYALKLLSNHLYSEWKMREKLYAKEADKPQVDEVIKYLKKQGFIDDINFIEEYLLYANNLNLGKNKIKENLLRKGIFQEDIEKITFKEKDEMNKAHNILPKLVKRYERYNARSQKDHIIQAYIREGFDLDIALDVTRDLDLHDEKKEAKLLKKDYELVKTRYSRKYKGRELKEKILAALLRKGYKGKDIYKMMGEYDEIC
ncbi:MAG: RecX family transcriptional regulator [Bacilli bacterium]|nr:RecX family transcriptional regulator [Bacilli bacterium]